MPGERARPVGRGLLHARSLKNFNLLIYNEMVLEMRQDGARIAVGKLDIEQPWVVTLLNCQCSALKLGQRQWRVRELLSRNGSSLVARYASDTSSSGLSPQFKIAIGVGDR